MANERRNKRNQHVSSENGNAENRTSHADGSGYDRYDPRPSAQFQHAHGQTDGDSRKNQQRETSGDSHSGDRHRDRFFRIRARHAHYGNDKESNRADGQNRRRTERKNCDDGHTRGAFHDRTSVCKVRVTQEARSHHFSGCPENSVTDSLSYPTRRIASYS